MTISRTRHSRPRAGANREPTSGHRRIAIYTRRSTDDEHQPFSIEAQLTALRSYINSQPGWVLVAEYTDDASGATTQRPDLQRALRAAKAGRFDVLLVYRVDRFSRRLSDLLDLLHELDETSVAFCSATEPFDTSTPIGRMLIQLLGVFAEFERETIIDRTINGMATKARKGKWAGGRRPYGYLIDRPSDKLTPHPDEAPIIREIFHLFTKQRLGTRAIAAELNQRGIPHCTNRPWSGCAIAHVLGNPAYVGDIVRRGVHVPDAHEPLVDRGTFETANTIRSARSDAHTQRAASQTDYHLTGLITCPDCGCTYIGNAAHGRNRVYRYYTCFSRNRYGSAADCTSIRLNADATDDAILHALADFYARLDSIMDQVIETARREFHDTHGDRAAELDAVTAQIRSTETAIQRYQAAFENGTMDDTAAGPRLKELQQQRAQLRGRRDDLRDDLGNEPSAPPPETVDRLRTELAHVVAAGTSGERKRLIEALVAEVRLTRSGELIPIFRVPRNANAGIWDDAGVSGAATTGSRNGGLGSPDRTRTYNLPVNSRTLCRLSYGGSRAQTCRPKRATRERLQHDLGPPATGFRSVPPSTTEHRSGTHVSVQPQCIGVSSDG